MPIVLVEILDAIKAGHRTAPEIHKHVSDGDVVDVTAINQRLRRLMELGFVAREKQRGSRNTFLYTVKPQQKKK